jgi:RNA polymerase sigma-70 factor (ECF subfamily)
VRIRRGLQSIPGSTQAVCVTAPPDSPERRATGVGGAGVKADAAAEAAAVVDALRSGDASAFAALAERFRRPLLAHCYRMLGSIDEAEDLVQETLLRAWRGRQTFEGRSLFRTWLYRIATNACLNAVERAPRRVMPQDVAPPVKPGFDPSDARDTPPWAPEIPWLQPCPDRLLEPAASSQTDPDAMIVSREAIELAFIAALQHLPARQRAILILREVLGWSAHETATLLETTVKSVNAALQRARETMRARRPGGREGTATRTTTTVTADEQAVLQRFMEAWERADVEALTALMREEARWAMPPAPLWFDGRGAIARLLTLFPPSRLGDIRMVATAANRQPAAIGYLRRHGQPEFRLTGLNVLRIENGEIAEITTFSPALLSAFDLAPTL